MKVSKLFPFLFFGVCTGFFFMFYLLTVIEVKSHTTPDTHANPGAEVGNHYFSGDLLYAYTNHRCIFSREHTSHNETFKEKDIRDFSGPSCNFPSKIDTRYAFMSSSETSVATSWMTYNNSWNISGCGSGQGTITAKTCGYDNWNQLLDQCYTNTKSVTLP